MSLATIAVEWGTGQVLWSIIWLFLFVLWIWMLIFLFGDIIRSDDLSGWAKALWVLFIIVLPFIGILAYLIVRGGSMADRQIREAKADEAAFASYVRATAGTGTQADELTKLAELHDSGKLDDAEYAAAKAKVLQS
ncbi:MAG: SHOCT domain-containing protein [Actinomycetota bacterium]